MKLRHFVFILASMGVVACAEGEVSNPDNGGDSQTAAPALDDDRYNTDGPRADDGETTPDEDLADNSAGRLAFPGVEGAGKYALGGRGGDVYHVTNLNDKGAGSLREGILSKNPDVPRTIVFDVCGTIYLKSVLKIDRVSCLTIAGQTAPGEGITLADRTLKVTNSSDIVLRFFRIRYGNARKEIGDGKDGLTTEYVTRFVLDHLSTSWTVDGAHDSGFCKDMTIQWCVYSEPLHDSGIHPEGVPHSKMMSIRDMNGNTTMHHCLLASSYQRFPTIGGGQYTGKNVWFDLRNNLLYNYGEGTNFGNCTTLAVNNYYAWGPENKSKSLPFCVKSESASLDARGYLSGNFFDNSNHSKYNSKPYEGVDYTKYDEKYGAANPGYVGGASRSTFELTAQPNLGEYAVSSTETAADAYNTVLARAGASLVRDAVDIRIVAGVKDKTGKIIDNQNQVGGWPAIVEICRPSGFDSDGDGMPDAWETANGLNAASATDGNGYTLSTFYTNLEMYLNSLVANIIE